MRILPQPIKHPHLPRRRSRIPHLPPIHLIFLKPIRARIHPRPRRRRMPRPSRHRAQRKIRLIPFRKRLQPRHIPRKTKPPIPHRKRRIRLQLPHHRIIPRNHPPPINRFFPPYFPALRLTPANHRRPHRHRSTHNHLTPRNRHNHLHIENIFSAVATRRPCAMLREGPLSMFRGENPAHNNHRTQRTSRVCINAHHPTNLHQLKSKKSPAATPPDF